MPTLRRRVGLQQLGTGASTRCGVLLHERQMPISCSTGLQRAAHQDGGDHHHPGGHLALQHQQRADAQHQRLQRDAHELGRGLDRAGALAGLGLQAEEAGVQPEPAPHHVRQHAHGLDRLGVAQVVASPGCWPRPPRGSPRPAACGTGLVDHGQGDQDDRAAQGEHAQPGVEQEDQRQVHREPGRIEEREQAVAGDELAHGGQVLQRLAGIAALPLEVLLEGGGVDPLVQPHVQPRADAHQHEAAHELQRAHERRRRRPRSRSASAAWSGCGWPARGRRPAACRCEGTSTSRLIMALKTATVRNARLKPARAWAISPLLGGCGFLDPVCLRTGRAPAARARAGSVRGRSPWRHERRPPPWAPISSTWTSAPLPLAPPRWLPYDGPRPTSPPYSAPARRR